MRKKHTQMKGIEK